MAELMGAPEGSRTGITKRFWEYVKSKDLQDPSDRRYVLCDELLQRVFGVKRLHAFGVAKLIGPHLLQPSS